MEPSMILVAVGAMGGLTVTLSLLLVIANKKLYVHEDPRVDDVEDMLPHANCGACGYPGCRPFAEALVANQTTPGKCSVSTPEGLEEIAIYLDVEVGAGQKMVARLACAGGNNVARNKVDYEGMRTCRAAALVAGGGKKCSWGCLGLADCMDVCDFDAIHMNSFSLPVVNESKCTACNACVVVCPKDLFSLQPVENRLWVACKNEEEGNKVLEDCQVGCTACSRCAFDAPDSLISMKKNLPVIDYSKPHKTTVPIQRCPTGAIVWLDEKRGPQKGPAAVKILRRSPLPTDFK
ncbi:MAG: Fe-S cluster protein [Acidobacteria bacterium]|nr:MAG: Fe-S cluster protein [Acidobacteriota bacterium]